VFSRYLAIYFAGALLIALALGAWSGVSLRRSEGSLLVYHYQLDKLEHAPANVATVFVGDSSLGNAIDAKLFGELAGAPTLNLALTASYGYAGSYNMLRRVLLRFRPRNVIIVQTADMPKREEDTLAALLVEEEADRQAGVWQHLSFELGTRLEYLQLIYNVDSFKRAATNLFVNKPRTAEFINDYPAQSGHFEPTAATIVRDTLRPGVNRGKLPYLVRIAELCRAEHLNCIYAHGPLLGEICAASRTYLDEASVTIRGAGLEVLSGTPLCLSATEVGDSMYHAAPSFKAQATREYFRLLAPWLR
jgi:hypothetical protein